MFVVLYRWRIFPNLERQFIENWSARTVYLQKKYNSRGSRLHRGSDDIFYAYAQWKSAEQRRRAFEAESDKRSESVEKMREAIKENFPEIELEMVSDYLISPEID